MHPSQLSIKDFTYQLPDKNIARFPLEERDRSRLLIYRDHVIQEDIYANLAGYLPQDALLVFNNTKVVAARMLFKKETGGIIEIFAMEPHRKYKDITTAMQTKKTVQWSCLIGGAGKWKHGQILEKQLALHDQPAILWAEIVEKTTDYFTVEFSWNPAHVSFAHILHLAGTVPIPPYLKRETAEQDHERYQTVYATVDGSVAAPTAGLHFTDQLFNSLKARGIRHAFLTLHVGAGTFLPVKSETLDGHRMHAEFIEVAASFIQDLVNHPLNIFAVGTTSLRTLESLYWMGVKCFLRPGSSLQELELTQWEVYEGLAEPGISAEEALTSLLYWMKQHSIEKLIARTQLLIAPMYVPRIIRGLITNFHQPNSTLLLLVAALIGDDWHKLYDYALQNNFRFLSYGDGCLLHFPLASAKASQ